MSSNLPPPATKVGGGLRIVQNKSSHAEEDDSPTPKTNVEQALSNQSQQDLEQALGIVNPNPTVSVRDALEHPKANASTYQHSGHPEKHAANRTNAGHVREIQQPGGAYGARRH